MKTVLKICCEEWDNASRDKRELAVAEELGAKVIVMCKGKNSEIARKKVVDGFDTYRFPTRWLGDSRILRPINYVITFLKWPIIARRFSPDIISGHNYPALLIGYFSTLFISKSKKPKLIYDSHEFELGRNTSKKRSGIKIRVIAHLEKFLMKRCAFSIMVNDVIADEVQRIHGLKERPIVVRNTPNLWSIDPAVCQQVRQEMITEFGSGELPSNVSRRRDEGTRH